MLPNSGCLGYNRGWKESLGMSARVFATYQINLLSCCLPIAKEIAISIPGQFAGLFGSTSPAASSCVFMLLVLLLYYIYIYIRLNIIAYSDMCRLCVCIYTHMRHRFSIYIYAYSYVYIYIYMYMRIWLNSTSRT